MSLVRPVLILAVLLLSAMQAEAQGEPAGTWAGRWERDGSTLVVEMLFSRSSGGYEGSFSSAPLRVAGVPLTHIRYAAPTLEWEIIGDESTTKFKGRLRGDRISGQFRDGSASGTFELTRSKSPNPRPVEEEVAFNNGSVVLRGTILHPAGPGPFPGVVFLHGSGPEGRWASRYLAREFARRGVAGLIYDKRGVGQSSGDWRTAGFFELAGDAKAAIGALKTRGYIAPDRIGLHGHSQGGTIAPWVASETPELACIVASAPAGLSMAEVEIFSLGNSIGLRDLPIEEKQRAERFVHAVVATAYEGAPRSELDRAWQEVRGQSWAFEPPSSADPYWSFSRRIATYEPLTFWRGVKAPALLIYGENDERIPARRSAARIADAYLGAQGKQLDVLFFPNADHNFRLPPKPGVPFSWPQTAAGYPTSLIEWVVRTCHP